MDLKRKILKGLKILSPKFRMEPEKFIGWRAPFMFFYDCMMSFSDKVLLIIGNIITYSSQIYSLKTISLYKIAPNLLNSESIVYSCGVGINIDFDLQISRQYKSKIYLFDPTPSAVSFMGSQPKNDLLFFEPLGVWIENKKMRFYVDRNKNHRNLSITNYFNTGAYEEADCLTIQEIMLRHGHSRIDLIKLDIEGSAMPVIKQLINETNIRPKQIVAELEMPQLIYGASLTDIIKFISVKKLLFNVLRSAGYKISTYGKAEFVAVLNSEIKKESFLSKNIKRFYSRLQRLKSYFIQSYFKFIVARRMRFIALPCIICGNNKNFTVLYDYDRYGLKIKTQRCRKCNLVMMRPSLTEDFIERFYSSKMYRGLYLGILKADENKNDNAFFKANIHCGFIDSLNLGQFGNVLDVGSAYGAFLLEFKKRNPSAKIYGVEPGTNFSSQNADKFEYVYSNVDEIPAEIKFDLITLWHVLEHFYDAKDILIKLSRHLSPSGRIIIEVPDLEKYTSIRFIHVAHNYHFNKETLTKLGSAVGLILEKYSDDNCIPSSAGMKLVFRKNNK